MCSWPLGYFATQYLVKIRFNLKLNLQEVYTCNEELFLLNLDDKIRSNLEAINNSIFSIVKLFKDEEKWNKKEKLSEKELLQNTLCNELCNLYNSIDLNIFFSFMFKETYKISRIFYKSLENEYSKLKFLSNSSEGNDSSNDSISSEYSKLRNKSSCNSLLKDLEK